MKTETAIVNNLSTASGMSLELCRTSLPPEPHTIDSISVLKLLEVEPLRGLEASEIERRRTLYGENTIQTVRQRRAWRILLDQFESIIVVLLALAAIVAWATGDRMEAGAILVVLALNALVGFATE